MDIKLSLEKADCIQEINTILKNLPLTNSHMDVNGAELQIKQLSVTGFSISLRELKPIISIAFEVTKKTLLANLVGHGIVSVTGSINYDINEDFVFSGVFRYLTHDWIDDPDVSIGGINFPIKSLVDSMIEKQTTNIEDLINQYLSGTDLKQWISPYLKFLQQEFNSTHATVTIDAVPTALRIDQINDSEDLVSIDAQLIANAKIHFGQKQNLSEVIPKLYVGLTEV